MKESGYSYFLKGSESFDTEHVRDAEFTSDTFMAAYPVDTKDYVPVTTVNGYCGADADGKNVTWTYASDGIMTFSGTGAMADYENATWLPWEDYIDSITTVVIEDGVTHLGRCALYGADNLTSVDLGNVQSIGEMAFRDVTKLEEVTIPSTMTTLSQSALCDCTGLKKITLPSNMTVIDYNALGGCTALEEITLPAGIMTIGGNAFSECASLASLDIPAGVTRIGSYAFYGCTALEEITLPDGLTEICDFAFMKSGLTGIKIPQDVTTVGTGAFSYAGSLAWVQIPDSVQTVRANGFNNCTALKDVYYGGTEAEWEDITIQENNDPLLNATIHYESVRALPGDFNEDDTLDEDDAIYVLRHVLLGDEYYPVSRSADVNRDGIVDEDDAIYLLRHVLLGDAYPL